MDGLAPDPGDVHGRFLCGPCEMVDSVKSSLGASVEADRIGTEVFRAEVAHADVDVDVGSTVTVAVDGVETTFALRSSGDTILDTALQQGIDPPYSCAGGACGTCRAMVLLGKAVMDQNHVLDADEVAGGYVLTCQAHPVSEEVRIDNDA